MKIFNPERVNHLPGLILFDMDNTFYDYEHAHSLSMNAVRDKVTKTFSITNARFDSAFAEARRQFKESLGKTAASHNRLLYMQRMLEIIGLGTQVVLSLDLEQTYWRTFLSNAVLFPNLKELLDDLRLLNIQRIVITDLTAQIQFRKILYFGLEHYFNYIVTSEEAGSDKPDAAPFTLALQKHNANDGKVWMIGDDPVSDIKGARLSIDAVTLQKLHDGVTPGTGDCAPDAAFHHFSDVRKLIKSLIAPA